MASKVILLDDTNGRSSLEFLDILSITEMYNSMGNKDTVVLARRTKTVTQEDSDLLVQYLRGSTRCIR